MAGSMIDGQLPDTDSISELARFWDEHDLTDFEDDLEEVTEPVFVRMGEPALNLRLSGQEPARLQKMAKVKGVDAVTLVHEWVLEKLEAAWRAGS